MTFNFKEAHLINIFITACVFELISKKASPYPRSSRFFLIMLSSRNFIVLHFTFKSVIYKLNNQFVDNHKIISWKFDWVALNLWIKLRRIDTQMVFVFLSKNMVYLSIYSWSLNSMSLNCVCPLTLGYISVVNNILLNTIHVCLNLWMWSNSGYRGPAVSYTWTSSCIAQGSVLFWSFAFTHQFYSFSHTDLVYIC